MADTGQCSALGCGKPVGSMLEAVHEYYSTFQVVHQNCNAAYSFMLASAPIDARTAYWSQHLQAPCIPSSMGHCMQL